MKKHRTRVRYITTWVLTVIFIAALFSKIRPQEVLQAARKTNVPLLLLSLFISALAHILFSTACYRKILSVFYCRLSFFEALILKIGSIPVKAIFPFKLGELARAAYLKKRYTLPLTRGIGSIAIGYVFNALALLCFFAIGGLYCSFTRQLQVFYCLLIIALFVILLLFLRNRWSKAAVSIFLYSLGFEGSKLLNIGIIFKALQIEIPHNALLLLAPVTILFSSLPITFWGLGTRESSIIFLFATYAASTSLLGAGLLISFVNALFPIILGILFMKFFLDKLLAIDMEKG